MSMDCDNKYTDNNIMSDTQQRSGSWAKIDQLQDYKNKSFDTKRHYHLICACVHLTILFWKLM